MQKALETGISKPEEKTFENADLAPKKKSYNSKKRDSDIQMLRDRVKRGHKLKGEEKQKLEARRKAVRKAVAAHRAEKNRAEKKQSAKL